MSDKNDKPYKGPCPADLEDSAGYADYISDAVFFLLCVAIATIIVYVLVPIFQPDMWRLL